MSPFNEIVRAILAHLKDKGVKGWSTKRVSDQAFFLSPDDRERFYKWLRRVKRGEQISRFHESTVKFERALRWIVYSEESLFACEVDSLLKRFDLIQTLNKPGSDQWVVHLDRFVRLTTGWNGSRLRRILDHFEKMATSPSRSWSDIDFKDVIQTTPRVSAIDIDVVGRQSDRLWSRHFEAQSAHGPPVNPKTNLERRRQPPSESTTLRANPTAAPVVVKWTGSKRRQAAEILGHFPRQFETYFEPFLGGGSMLLAVLLSDIRIKRFRCSDSYAPLIGIWNVIKDAPDSLNRYYEHFWNELQERGEDFYFETRAKFNEDKDPLKLFALLRTCRNGWVQFNKKSQFNSGFHHQRPGIHPKRLRLLVDHRSVRLNSADVQFEVKDYRSVESSERDFLYLDPPYETPTIAGQSCTPVNLTSQRCGRGSNGRKDLTPYRSAAFEVRRIVESMCPVIFTTTTS